MTVQRISVALLARELGIRPNELMAHAKRAGVPRSRVAATFTPAEADRVRAAHDAERKRLRAVRASGPTMPHMPSSVAVRATPCDCCGLDIFTGSRCSVCQGHYFIEGEDSSRRDDRLYDHRRRLAPIYSPALAEVDRYREQTRNALHSREIWRAALVEVMVHHESSDEGCRCGAPHYPCPSVETLERVNRGVARQVEGYLAMSVEEMREELYGNDDWLGAYGDAG